MLDVVVLGSGVAGLTAAITAAERGLSLEVITKGDVTGTATWFAQGGIAAALGDDDSPALHHRDTLVAGAGLCDSDAVTVLVEEGPRRVRELVARGTRFDTVAHGDPRVIEHLQRTREGGHSAERILHAGGDASGREIERSLSATSQRLHIPVRHGWDAVDLLVSAGRCRGVAVLDPSGRRHEIEARNVVLATGGAGQLFWVTTNPGDATGDGIAIALRAGVAVADVEFVQFHPTALHDPRAMPRPLLTEALRGEGAVLRDDRGERYLAGVHPLAELAPRDVVARSTTQVLLERDLDHVWLDATPIPDLEHRFPTVWASCQRLGIDPRRDWIPAAPAAHYLCGGVLTDLHGATTLPGCWAVGEVACSGINGANRLASNSLLEGTVFGARAVEAIAGGVDGPCSTGALLGVEEAVPVGVGTMPVEVGTMPVGVGAMPVGIPAVAGTRAFDRELLQRTMTRDVGVLRDDVSLARALTQLDDISTDGDRTDLNLLTVARAVVRSAIARRESRGGHTRTDHPDPSDIFLGRFVHRGDQLGFAPRRGIAPG